MMPTEAKPATGRLPSYRPCECCGCDCPFGSEAEPCWGNVTIWSDFADDDKLHSCEGHSWSFAEPYRPSAEMEGRA